MKTLYLTAKEQEVFDALSEQLREGWEVEPANIAYEDSERKRRIRMEHARFTDARLKKFRTSYTSATTAQDAEKALQNADFRDLPDSDAREILYALGPDILSQMIIALLQDAKNDTDIEEATGYSVARHLFFGQA